MVEEDHIRQDLIARMFYLVTVAAEDAAALAAEGQSRNLGPDQAKEAAVRLRTLGERIDILSSAIVELSQGSLWRSA